MRLSSLAAAGLAGLALAGCASSGSQSTNAAPEPTAAASASAGEASGAVRWEGTFSPTSQRTGSLGGADRARTYGNVTVAMSPTDRTRSRVRISVSVPATAGGQGLKWALLPGRCGSGAMPVMATNLFPPLEVGANGRAELNTELAMATPASGSFHVNVYWPGGDQLENVMTCSNLRREG